MPQRTHKLVKTISTISGWRAFTIFFYYCWSVFSLPLGQVFLVLHTKLSIRANRRFFTPFAALENINDPVFDNYKEVSALKKKKTLGKKCIKHMVGSD